jgi:CubicO group peptidase (beta-lactamase class C family)
MTLSRIVLLAAACLSLASCSEPATLGSALEQVAAKAVASGEFNGNILVARGGVTLYEASIGTANVETAATNEPESRFAIASVSKPITAVLVLQLVEQGKLSPDTRLDAVTPKLIGTRAGAITIHQLLTHTSGIAEQISADPWRRITFDQVRAAAVKPVNGIEYSNTGYVVLALVIEQVTGQSYEAALQSRVFVPADMRDSGVLRTGTTPDHFSVGHHGQMEVAAAEFDFAPEAVDGAGSIYSTTRDLLKFDRALSAHKLLKPATQALMYTQHIPGRYGYGWFLSEQGGKYYPWHAGDMAGYAAAMARQVHRDEVVIVLGNTAATKAKELQHELLKVLKDLPPT